MTDLDDEEITRRLESDVSDTGGLMALLFCLLTVLALLVAGISAFLNAG